MAGIDEGGVGDIFEPCIVKLVKLRKVSQADFCFLRASALEDARVAGLYRCAEVDKVGLEIGWQSATSVVEGQGIGIVSGGVLLQASGGENVLVALHTPFDDEEGAGVVTAERFSEGGTDAVQNDELENGRV